MSELHPYIQIGREVVEIESRAIASLGSVLGDAFVRAVDLVLGCKGHIVVTGMGKPGFIAQNLSAIMASTGTPSFYLHPGDAVHGDLGRVMASDVVIALSNSGKTEELLRLLPSLSKIGAKVIAIVGDASSPLGRGAEVALEFGRIDEACPMGLVPTASTAALHAICDALAMAVLRHREITDEEYALFHPGGALGRRVMRVSELMRTGSALPVVAQTEPLHRAVAVMTNTPGRPGATTIVDEQGRLVGVFTDGDLRRLVERGGQDFSIPVREVMGKNPTTCRPDQKVVEAGRLMREKKVDQLPVVDSEGHAVGFIDVQDLLAAKFV